MASAEDVGKKLLAQVEECGLDEVSKMPLRSFMHLIDYLNRYYVSYMFKTSGEKSNKRGTFRLSTGYFVMLGRTGPKQTGVLLVIRSSSLCLLLQAAARRICSITYALSLFSHELSVAKKRAQ